MSMDERDAFGSLIVAIDGPAGSGKSSVSKEVARTLGLGYLDTGAMYRAVTFAALESGIDLSDQDAVAQAVIEADIQLSTDPDEQRVVVNGRDVTKEIREPRISERVSDVSTNLKVRENLVERQRNAIVDAGRIVAEGRDITTVVAPFADARILLTASEEVRMKRRGLQLNNTQSAQALAQQVGERDKKDSSVVNFMEAAEGVTLVDTSELNFEQSVEAVLTVVEYEISKQATAIVDGDDEADEQRAEALLAGLQDYELDDEDAALLAGEGWEADEPGENPPVVAIVGRPNVGKSTLVNRILGRREAVVEDLPGVTRDRVTYDAEWNLKRFRVVDTGGWEADAKGMDRLVAEQAERAVDVADVVVLVVDAVVGATAADEAIVKMLRRKGRPVLLVANKVDGPSLEADAMALWNLGFGEPHPVSSLHGRGTADVLDELIKMLPEESAFGEADPEGGPRRVALLGRPNVGKSSLLNKLVGHERAVVSDESGTTRDPIDEFVELDGRIWKFVDTAGLRRKQHMASGADYYASLRTASALDKAEAVVVLLAVDEELAEQDQRILQQVIDAGRCLVLAFNKWDKLEDERRYYLEREIEQDLKHVSWAPRVNISAKTGWHKDKLAPALDIALESWDRRIPTGKLNSFLGELVAEHPHPLRGGKQPRILFATQASARPPKFVLFTTGFLDPGYRRFIERRLRETFDFRGTPIDIQMRVRERRGNKRKK